MAQVYHYFVLHVKYITPQEAYFNNKTWCPPNHSEDQKSLEIKPHTKQNGKLKATIANIQTTSI